MRAQEFITEKVAGTLTIGDFTVQVDYHVIDRSAQRWVYPNDIDKILRRLTEIKTELDKTEPNSKFWIYDPDLDVSIGMAAVDPKKRVFRLNTTLPKKPWDGPRPIIELPARKTESVAESTVSGSIATVATPLGGMISRTGMPNPAKYMNSVNPVKRKKQSRN